MDQLGETARYARELSLVEEDLRDYPAHPRLEYYVGALAYHLAAARREAGAPDAPLEARAVAALASRADRGERAASLGGNV